jgi:hypothetical protein
MNALRIVDWLGVDSAQWAVLVRAYLRMDLRAGSGASRPGDPAPRMQGARPYTGLLFLTMFSGVMMGLVAARIPDLLVGMTVVTTYSAVNTAMLVLMDFSAPLLAPTDYAVLAHRPVSSRTWFAARLATMLVYVTALALAIALVPSLTYGLWRGLGWRTAAAVAIAIVLCSVTAAILLNNASIFLLRVVHPQRIRRAGATLQLLAASLFYVALYFASTESLPSVMRLSYDHSPWLWMNPAAWFAAWVPVTAGTASRPALFGALGAAVLTAACVPLAAGVLARDYASQVGEIGAAGEPARPRSRNFLDIPGFRRNEARAVALLVRAQFRYDTRFRLGIFAVVPLMLFYVVMDNSGLADPFAADRPSGGGMMHMAIIFMPLTLHGALRASDSWRAAWIFFATPASAVRLVLAAKNFSALVFLGGYVALLAAVWSWYFERVWHALVHAVALGLVAHLLLQTAVMLTPSLPFATEPKQAQETSRVFGLMFTGAIAGMLVSVLLPIVYARPALAVAFFTLVLAATAAMETLVRRRVTAAMAELEFR